MVSVLEDHNYKGFMAKDEIIPKHILCQICEKMQQSTFGIFEISEHNSNVMFELGIMYGLGKPVILLRNIDYKKPSSDLGGIEYINYANMKQLKKELIKTMNAIEKFINERSIIENGISIEEIKETSKRIEKLPNHERERLYSKGILIYYGREKTINELTKITIIAKENDILFGHCRTCMYYPDSYLAEVRNAVKRGVKCLILVQESADTIPFIKFCLQFNKVNVTVKSLKSDDMRIYGIKNKEFMFVFPVAGEYMSLHFKDEKMSSYLYQIFSNIWNEGKLIEQEEDIDWR